MPHFPTAIAPAHRVAVPVSPDGQPSTRLSARASMPVPLSTSIHRPAPGNAPVRRMISPHARCSTDSLRRRRSPVHSPAASLRADETQSPRHDPRQFRTGPTCRTPAGVAFEPRHATKPNLAGASRGPCSRFPPEFPVPSRCPVPRTESNADFARSIRNPHPTSPWAPDPGIPSPHIRPLGDPARSTAGHGRGDCPKRLLGLAGRGSV
jgi:hypothetical protein